MVFFRCFPPKLEGYIRRVEKVDGKLADVEIQTIPMVKDPRKELNPQK
ncbi:MAG: hypothetical protein WA417_19260 [Stellaceae bacterium]